MKPTVNACRQWTKLGHPIRHVVCKNLPLNQCVQDRPSTVTRNGNRAR
jgi:hypothetical protein